MNAAEFVNSAKYAIVSYRASGYRQDVDWAMCPGVKLPFMLDLSGTVDGNGVWRWNSHGEPKDWSKRAIVDVTIRNNQAEWDRRDMAAATGTHGPQTGQKSPRRPKHPRNPIQSPNLAPRRVLTEETHETRS